MSRLKLQERHRGTLEQGIHLEEVQSLARASGKEVLLGMVVGHRRDVKGDQGLFRDHKATREGLVGRGVGHVEARLDTVDAHPGRDIEEFNKRT